MFKNKTKRYRYEIIDDPDNAEYPKHPDRLSKQPGWTDNVAGRMPTFYLSTAFLGFGLTYVLVGIVGLLLHAEPQRAMQWMGVVGLLLGFAAGKYLIEPRLIIPFEQGTPEQKKEAVRRMNEYLDELAEAEAYAREAEQEALEQPNFDPAVFDDEEDDAV